MDLLLPFRPDALATRTLRDLTVARHPRGQPHFSAASGLVCAHGRAYVISDDEHHLAVFRDLRRPGRLHRILPGDLPHSAKARKQLKPDLEALLHLPPAPGARRSALVAFGSGSRPNRDVGILVPLDAQGEPEARGARPFDLKPFYLPLREQLGEINIEGALLQGRELLLLNRGAGGDHAPNAVVRYAMADLMAVMDGQRRRVRPRALRRYALGAIEGVPLGFTDATALGDGGWLFSAAAEDRADSYADGPCHGTALGRMDASGELMALHRLAAPIKVEGIAARPHAAGITLCLVTDADDPARSAQLLLAEL